VQYFAIKNWDKYPADATMDQDFMIRYASGVMRDMAKRGFDGRKAGA